MPRQADGTLRDGALFVDNVPVTSRDNKGSRFDLVDGAIIWVNKSEFQKEFQRFDPLKDTMYWDEPGYNHPYFMQQIMALETPEAHQRILEALPKEVTTAYNSEFNPYPCYELMNILTAKLAEHPHLFKRDPKWFVEGMRDSDYIMIATSDEGERKVNWSGSMDDAIAEDRAILLKKGYIQVHPFLRTLGVPSAVDLICHMEDTGEIPKREYKLFPWEMLRRYPQPIQPIEGDDSTSK